MKKYLKQIWYEAVHQPVIAVVTVTGTALAIFLIMAVVMLDSIQTRPFAPESRRPLFLHAKFINIGSLDGQSNSSANISEPLVRRLYDNTEGSAGTTIMTETQSGDISAIGAPTSVRYFLPTDDRFWQVFDFNFLAGEPYSANACDSRAQVTVLTRSLAEFLFGSVEGATGNTVKIKQRPFRVVGVVEDVSPLATTAYAELYIPYRSMNYEEALWDDDGYFGPFRAVILAKDKDSFATIRADIEARKRSFDAELHGKDMQLLDHGSPFDQSVVGTVHGSNTDPDDSDSTIRIFTYIILLLIPAINLSSLTQGRLRSRIAEIGVRRSFGATRASVIFDIIVENFVITIAGALIGLLLTVIFGLFFGDAIFAGLKVQRSVNISIGMILDWKFFAVATGVAFILNLLSSGIPAWRASRVDPVAALSGKI